ncbi:MAG: A/G-specific adenine glycosylase, partial [Pseudomonadota bacterium]
MSDGEINNFRKKILVWYDKNQRVLPWRAPSHERPDPYHEWLSEIMLQQTTVATVKSYFEKFIAIWPMVNDLANADRDAIMK